MLQFSFDCFYFLSKEEPVHQLSFFRTEEVYELEDTGNVSKTGEENEPGKCGMSTAKHKEHALSYGSQF